MRNVFRSLAGLAFAGLLVLACGSAFAADSDILLQGFHWGSAAGWYSTVQGNAGTIASAGFTAVWLPPATATADAHGYLPTQWYSLSGPYGNQAALTSCISALKGQRLKVIADIVINHRCGTANWADFSNPAFANNAAAVCSSDEWGQGTGGADSGMGYDGGRDLAHANASVQTEIKNWMNWLKSTIGFTGWRYDFVKGYSGNFVGIYNSATAPNFSVGEYWADITGDYYASGSGVDYHRQVQQNWMDASGSSAFDFTTKWQLMLACDRGEYWRLKDPNGKPIGLIGWSPSKTVTFLDNHDTGASPYGQNHWIFTSANLEQGYAYILTHPGVPSVFWAHYFNWGADLQTKIKNLIALRKAQGITAVSPVSILVAEAGRYAAKINNNTIVKIGPNAYDPGTGWTLALSGNGWAVWKSGGGSTGVTTTVKCNFALPSGSTMYIRGSLAPLSWTAGIPMTLSSGVWTWSTTSIASGAAFEYKMLKDDGGWSDGANFLGNGGGTYTITPTFNGNFYDVMDNLNNWTVSNGTGVYKWKISNYTAVANGCSTESKLTMKFGVSKSGTVTLAFKYKTANLDTGEYLAVDILKGTTWTQVASYSGTVAWKNVSLNVSSYASTSMKLRFRAKMSGVEELVGVDNVTLSMK